MLFRIGLPSRTSNPMPPKTKAHIPILLALIFASASAPAMQNEEALGNASEYGSDGTEQNYSIAKQHYLNCVNSGDPTGNCANRLGMLVLNPIAGGSRDGDEALGWLEKCKSKGGDCARNYATLIKFQSQGSATIKGVPIHFGSSTMVAAQDDNDSADDNEQPAVPRQTTAQMIGDALSQGIQQGSEEIQAQKQQAAAIRESNLEQRRLDSAQRRQAAAQQQAEYQQRQELAQQQARARQEVLQEQQQVALAAAASSTLQHNGQIATKCVGVDSKAGQMYGAHFYNKCPYTVNVIWCDTTDQHPYCDDFNGSDDLTAAGTDGSRWPVDSMSKYYKLRFFACKGPNTVFHPDGSKFNVQCNAE